jgi:hypothetical protein
MKAPDTLDECIAALPKVMGKTDTLIFKNTPEDQIPFSYHDGLGRWIRNKWGLWQNSRLAGEFKNMGITHADDMSGIILRAWHRSLNNKPVEPQKLAQLYKS